MAGESTGIATEVLATDPAEGDVKQDSTEGEANGTIDYEAEYQKNKDRDTEFDKRDADLKTREGRVLKSEDVMGQVTALSERMGTERDADRMHFGELMTAALGATVDPDKRAAVGDAVTKATKDLSDRSAAEDTVTAQRAAIAKTLVTKAEAAGIDINANEKVGEWRKVWTEEYGKQKASGAWDMLPFYRLDSTLRDIIDVHKDETAATALKVSEAGAEAMKKELAEANGEDDLSTGSGRTGGASDKLEGMTPTQKIAQGLADREKAESRS